MLLSSMNRKFVYPVGIALTSATLLTTKQSFSESLKVSPIANQVVLITGATAGIGKACARRLAKHDAKLVLLGRRDDRLKELKDELIKAYPLLKVHTVSLSVTDLDAVAALPSTLPKEFADVDILINNAGLALGVSSVENNKVSDAKTVIDTNVTGLIALSTAFLPGMKKRNRGHLVNMGSVAGHYAYATGTGMS